MPVMPTLVAKRPVVSLNGRDVPAGNILEIVVEHDLHLPSSCLVTVHDDQMDPTQTLGGPLKVGDPLVVKVNLSGVAPQPQEYTLFQGLVEAIERQYDERSQVLRIQAYDESLKLHVGRTSKAYVNVSDSALIQTICGDCGVTPKADASLSSPVYDHVNRVNQTAWEFLQGRAAERGFVMRMTGHGGLVPAPPMLEVAKPEIPGPALTASPSGGDLLLIEFHPRVAATGAVKKVKVLGWDWKQKREITGQASSPQGDESVQGLSTSLSSALSSSGLTNDELHITDRVVLSQDDADKVAKAALEQLASTYAEADGVVDGSAKLVPGTLLEIKDMGTEWDGKWLVSSARHVIDNVDGYLTHFSVAGRNDRTLMGLVMRGRSNGPGRAGGPPVFGVVVGLVSDCNDPDKLGRVKVKLPWLDATYETDWVRQTSPVGGKDRGLFLPLTVDDEVLIAFEHGDTRRPYIIGSVYNGVDKPPNSDYTKDGKSETWILKSTTGNIVRFRDNANENHVSIDVEQGKYTFTLDKTNQKIVMHSDGKVEIDAKGKITISSQDDIVIDSKKNIELKAMQNVKIDATSNFEAKGTAGVKVESTATLSVKGSIATVEASGVMSVKGATVMLG